jgi:hypothetical protein
LSRLIIVDQSLKGVGGHHFDYVLQVARAAARQNLEVIVAAHRAFSARTNLEHYARIIPHFSQTTYSRFSLLAGLRAMHRRPPLTLDPPTTEAPGTLDLSSAEQRIATSALEPRTLLASFEPTVALPGHSQPVGRWGRTRQANWLRRLRQSGRFMAGLFRQMHETSGRNRAVRRFATDCRNLFPLTGLLPTDHVFFTTISDLELAGLLVYWLGAPESYLPHWHMQFHFDAFVGRPPEYRKQYAALDPLRCLFEDIDHAIPTHQLNYYATTAAIADQYERLASRPIRELTYPINDAFRPAAMWSAPRVAPQLVVWGSEDDRRPDATAAASPWAAPQPLPTQINEQTARVEQSQNFPPVPLWDPQAAGVPIVLAGAIRAEKGQKHLSEIWPQLRQQILDPGWGFLVCQRAEKRPWYRRRFAVTTPRDPSPDAQLQYLPHPLSTAQYQELIRRAGIGLLTYDRRSYANRRAGIFGEYLASGVPTLVPAGTWMADQLVSENFRYQQELLREYPIRRSWNHADFDWTQWNVPSGNGSITFDGGDVPAYAWSPEFPACGVANSGHASPQFLLQVRFHWVWPKEVGTYSRWEILFYDSQRQVIQVETAIVGQQNHTSAQSVIFRIPPGTTYFRLGLKNAYHERNATIHRLLLDVLETPTAVPVGVIGLTYDQTTQLPGRLLELCQHHAHYLQSARQQAAEWCRRHDPLGTIQQLLSAESHAQRSAA